MILQLLTDDSNDIIPYHIVSYHNMINMCLNEFFSAYIKVQMSCHHIDPFYFECRHCYGIRSAVDLFRLGTL